MECTQCLQPIDRTPFIYICDTGIVHYLCCPECVFYALTNDHDLSMLEEEFEFEPEPEDEFKNIF